jgi:hypothetical protein
MDYWCGVPLAQSLNIHQTVVTWLPQKVSDIIINQQWHIPPSLDLLFPSLKNMVQQVTLPNDAIPDQFCWKNSPSGNITLKLAYDFKRNHHLPMH